MNAKERYDIVEMLEQLTYEQKLDFLAYIKALQAEAEQKQKQASTSTDTSTDTSNAPST